MDINIFAEALRIADEERRQWEDDPEYRKHIIHERLQERQRREDCRQSFGPYSLFPRPLPPFDCLEDDEA